MISKKDLKSYDFSNIEEYFSYIVESNVNGNFSQAKNLIKELSKVQKKEFLEWLKEEIYEHQQNHPSPSNYWLDGLKKANKTVIELL